MDSDHASFNQQVTPCPYCINGVYVGLNSSQACEHCSQPNIIPILPAILAVDEEGVGCQFENNLEWWSHTVVPLTWNWPYRITN